MGSRGASSGRKDGSATGGLKVTAFGETTEYYFFNHKGKNYYQRGIDGTPEPTPMNMSRKQFKERIEKNGGKTESISKESQNRKEKERWKERENRPDYELGNAFNERGWGAKRKKQRYDRFKANR